ncbi:MAG TPA: hypothetical protein VGM50_23040 [Gemmatimonadaceae bacterium]|jgi:hypothetical protein
MTPLTTAQLYTLITETPALLAFAVAGRHQDIADQLNLVDGSILVHYDVSWKELLRYIDGHATPAGRLISMHVDDLADDTQADQGLRDIAKLTRLQRQTPSYADFGPGNPAFIGAVTAMHTANILSDATRDELLAIGERPGSQLQALYGFDVQPLDHVAVQKAVGTLYVPPEVT